MNILFQTERVELIHTEMKNLLVEHYEELTKYKDKIELKPIWQRYIELEQNNRFFLFTARKNEELIGYSGFFLDRHIHYENTKVASNDVIFLKKEYRQGTTGIRLIKFSEQSMKDLGADKINWHIKFSNDFRPILHRMGYIDEDVIVSKMLV